MSYRVHVTDKALADVDSVLLWLQTKGAVAASQRWYSASWRAIDALETQAERCSLAAEAKDVGREVRELLFGKRRGTYRILFEVRGQNVFILRIRHSARDAFNASDL